MDNLGAIGGPVVALGLVGLIGARTAILLSIIPGLLAAIAILYAIRHAPQLTEREREPVRLQLRPVVRGQLGRLMFAVGAFEFGNLAATLLILRATELLQPSRSHTSAVQLALVLYTAYNIAATLVSIPAGHAADRAGNLRVLATGSALFGLAFLGLARIALPRGIRQPTSTAHNRRTLTPAKTSGRRSVASTSTWERYGRGLRAGSRLRFRVPGGQPWLLWPLVCGECLACRDEASSSAVPPRLLPAAVQRLGYQRLVATGAAGGATLVGGGPGREYADVGACCSDTDRCAFSDTRIGVAVRLGLDREAGDSDQEPAAVLTDAENRVG